MPSDFDILLGRDREPPCHAKHPKLYRQLLKAQTQVFKAMYQAFCGSEEESVKHINEAKRCLNHI